MKLLLLSLLVACKKEPAHPEDPGPAVDPADDSAAPADSWTVLVYMDGDNDLESYVMHDLNELEEGGEGGGVRVLVQADRIEGYAENGGDWTGTRRYEIVGDKSNAMVSTLVEDMGELDMGDPQTLADFLSWAREFAPAEHYALFLWNHGDSWTAQANLIASDDTSGSWMSIAEGDLTAGLQAHVAEAGPIDLIGFDACYMASWEVAHSLKDQGRVMLASEAWVGGEGVFYAPFLKGLRADPGGDVGDLAVAAAALSVAEGGERTFSAIDLTKIEAISAAVDALAGWGLSSTEATRVLDQARRRAEGADPDWPKWYLDLGSLADSAAEGAPPEASGATLRAELDAAVLGRFGDETWAWTSGLTIMGDVHDAESLVLYQEGSWSKDGRWDDFLIAAGESGQAVR
jgi:Clostripain family